MKPPNEKTVTCVKIFSYITVVQESDQAGQRESQVLSLCEKNITRAVRFLIFPQLMEKLRSYISSNSDLSMPSN